MPLFRSIQVCCLVFLLVLGIAARADERILNYQSDITVQEDATLRVRETIVVRSEAEQILHGIYRDFPTRYRSRGKTYRVDFHIESVTRDGNSEPYHTERQGNGVRVYIGSPDTTLSPGQYTYQLTYRTDRQFGFFPDHDELYWNVTGNGWVFPIDRAGATVTLPAEVPASAMKVEGYTGPSGSQARDLTATVDRNDRAQFATTRPLDAYEGLTIVVTFPKGFVQQPPPQSGAALLWEDYRTQIFAGIALLVLLGGYFLAWLRVGRDPPRGTIIPLFTPPNEMSPAALRYIARMGADNTAVAAALVNLAVKGQLTITEAKGAYTLTKNEQKDAHRLSREETDLLNVLFADRSSLELQNTHYAVIQQGMKAARSSLAHDYGHDRYFLTNRIVQIAGMLFTLPLLLLVAVLTMQPDSTEPFAGLSGEGDLQSGYIVGTLFLLIGGGVFVGIALPALKRTVSGNGCTNGCLGIFLTVWALGFGGGGALALASVSVTYLLFVLATIVLNAIFAPLLTAYTPAGRKLLDAIEGFKLYLSVGERDRLASAALPERTPELFEAYLPYALALGVEQQWAEQFSDVLARAGIERQQYSPHWYSSSSHRIMNAGGLASSLGGAFSNSVSSASSPPGSSSGSGGGGSSGGGGGGGGGGGW